jgi:type IV pilus assembly protein PilB
MEISRRFSFRNDVLLGIKKFYGESDPDGVPESEPGDGVDLGQREEGTGDLEFITAESREDAALRELNATKQRTPAVRCVSNILALAAQKQASDIHVEPRAGNTIVRIRVDGILRELMTIPADIQTSVISRIKILSNMDIAERRVPQDGRFLMVYQGERFDLRVSTLPTHFGEKIAMRILDPRAAIITLDRLGMPGEIAADIRRIVSNPQGMLLVTGPTGSGKSTTLYAALNILRSPGRNIITVEDPVEYLLDGVNQVQVHAKAGLTFAASLRSILRQDPNIIMVGEIRDGETAEIALKAAQTGHMVLSTLHTNDSIAVISRLLDLGVPAYLIASSVTGVLAQRLVRRLCQCRRKAATGKDFIHQIESIGVSDAHTFPYEYYPVGCELCDNTGYKGRVGIYELLLVEGPIRESIYSGASAEDVSALAHSAGFRTMQEDALQKVREGVASLTEVRRVIPFNTTKVDRCESCSRELLKTYAYCPFCSAARGTGNTISSARFQLARTNEKA